MKAILFNEEKLEEIRMPKPRLRRGEAVVQVLLEPRVLQQVALRFCKRIETNKGRGQGQDEYALSEAPKKPTMKQSLSTTRRHRLARPPWQLLNL